MPETPKMLPNRMLVAAEAKPWEKPSSRTPMPSPNARMEPMAESRSRGRAPRVAISAATTRDPARAPVTGSPATTRPAAAPVKASSAVPLGDVRVQAEQGASG